MGTHQEVHVVLSLVLLRCHIRRFQRSLRVLSRWILKTVNFLHLDLLNLVLFYQRLKLHRVGCRLVPSVRKCILVISYVLLLDHRGEEIRIGPSRLVVVVVRVIMVHVPQLE